MTRPFVVVGGHLLEGLGAQAGAFGADDVDVVAAVALDELRAVQLANGLDQRSHGCSSTQRHVLAPVGDEGASRDSPGAGSSCLAAVLEVKDPGRCRRSSLRELQTHRSPVSGDLLQMSVQANSVTTCSLRRFFPGPQLLSRPPCSRSPGAPPARQIPPQKLPRTRFRRRPPRPVRTSNRRRRRHLHPSLNRRCLRRAPSESWCSSPPRTSRYGPSRNGT